MDKYYINLIRDALHKAVDDLQHAQNYVTNAQFGGSHDYWKAVQRIINSIRRLADELGKLAHDETLP